MYRQAVVDLLPQPAEPGQPFILKQFSLIDLMTREEKFFLFRPPSSDDEPVLDGDMPMWTWTQGENPYEHLDHILREITREQTFLYVRSAEKCMFLENRLDKPILDLGRFGCPSMRKLVRDMNLKCEFCQPGYPICSHIQARCLATWAYANPQCLDMCDKTVRLKTYANWSSMQDPSRLSHMGFYHVTNTVNGIRCLYCGFFIRSVKATTNVEVEHEEYHPECIMHDRD